MVRVYIPNTGGKHDFSPAEEYGKLVLVSERLMSPYKTGHMVRIWERVLQDSGPDDYILICSLTVLCMIGAAMFAVKHGTLNILQYREETKKYHVKRHILRKKKQGE